MAVDFRKPLFQRIAAVKKDLYIFRIIQILYQGSIGKDEPERFAQGYGSASFSVLAL